MNKKLLSKELVEIAKVLKAGYFRLSQGFRGHEMYILEKQVGHFISLVKNGNDIKPEMIDSIIDQFKKVKDNMREFQGGEVVPDEYK